MFPQDLQSRPPPAVSQIGLDSCDTKASINAKNSGLKGSNRDTRDSVEQNKQTRHCAQPCGNTRLHVETDAAKQADSDE